MVVLRSKKNVSKTSSRSRSRANIRSRTKTNFKSKSRSRTRKFMRGGANAPSKFNTGGVSVKNLKSGFESPHSSISGPPKLRTPFSSFDPSHVKTSNPATILKRVTNEFSSAKPAKTKSSFRQRALHIEQHPKMTNPLAFIESSREAGQMARLGQQGVGAATTVTGAPATLGEINKYNPATHKNVVGWTTGPNPMSKVTGVSNTESFGRARIVSTPEPENILTSTISNNPSSEVQTFRVSSSGPNVGSQAKQAKQASSEPNVGRQAKEFAQTIQSATPTTLISAETVPASTTTVSSVEPINLMNAREIETVTGKNTGARQSFVGSRTRQASSEPNVGRQAKEFAQTIQSATPTLISAETVPSSTLSVSKTTKPFTSKTVRSSSEPNVVSQTNKNVMTTQPSIQPQNVESFTQPSITSTEPASLTSTGITNVENARNIAQIVSKQISNPNLATESAQNKRPGVYFPQQGESVIDETVGFANQLYAVPAAGTSDNSGYVTIEPSDTYGEATRRVSTGKRKPSSAAVKTGKNIAVTDPNSGYLKILPSDTGDTGDTGASGASGVSGFSNPGYVDILPVKGVENPGYISTTPLGNFVTNSLYNSSMTVISEEQGYKNLGSGYENIDPNTGNVYKIKDPNIMSSTSQELTEATANKRNYLNEDLYADPQIYEGIAPLSAVENNNAIVPMGERYEGYSGLGSNRIPKKSILYAGIQGYHHLRNKDAGEEGGRFRDKYSGPGYVNIMNNPNNPNNPNKINTTNRTTSSEAQASQATEAAKAKEEKAKEEALKRLAQVSIKKAESLPPEKKAKVIAAKAEMQSRAEQNAKIVAESTEAAESNALERQILDQEANTAEQLARKNAEARLQAANNELAAARAAEAALKNRKTNPINPALLQELATKQKALQEMQTKRAAENAEEKLKEQKKKNNIRRAENEKAATEAAEVKKVAKQKQQNNALSSLNNLIARSQKNLTVNAILKRRGEEAVTKARAANAKARVDKANVAARMAILERQKAELEALQAEVRKAKVE
jgi:hypothetical protein